MGYLGTLSGGQSMEHPPLVCRAGVLGGGGDGGEGGGGQAVQAWGWGTLAKNLAG